MSSDTPNAGGILSGPASPGAPASRLSTPGPQRPPHIPDHELLRRIGQGSYGEVWLARSALGRLRAVKIIYRSRFQDPRPFEREFEGIQRFEPISRSHPSQLAILHVGKHDDGGCFYYVMELADPVISESVISNQCSVGPLPCSPSAANSAQAASSTDSPNTDLLITEYSPRTLRSDLERHSRLPPADCVQIGLSLATALAHLHRNCLVHRDIKPSNVIFVNGVPKLGDIGLVAAAGDTQSIVGTEGYIPPEGPGTPQADLYSLGKVLYEISTGMDRRRFAELPEDLRAWPDRDAVAEFNEIVLKACAKDPARRYPSAEELHADLALLQSGQSVKRKRTIQRRSAAIAKFSLVAALIAVTAAGAFLLHQAVSRSKPGQSGEWRQLEMKGTRNREAWNAYIMGLRYYEQETADGSKRAIEHLKEAARLDPKFALPWAALAEIYRWNAYLFPSEQEAMREGKKAALQALALDDSLAQAHKEVGYFAAHVDRDFAKATNELQRAIKLNPEYSNGHAVYAWLLLEMRRFEEAKQEMRLALKLDPVFARSMCTASVLFRAAGEQDEAIAQVRKALELDPHYWLAFERLGEIHEERGEFPEAIENFRKAAIAHEVDPEKAAQRSTALGHAVSAAGARGYWQKKLELADLRSKNGNELYDIAMIYMHLGETNSALDFLEKVEAQKSGAAFQINFDRCFDSVRSDPRFQALLPKLGLEK